ncbi:hypothetical protein [Mycobacterium tuberculosis]|uniref:hypothetical protein n=1 Tax=Mycobacterium tuberculosis TaxID=1773 RepID=UPI00272A312F|nr:hypothetical protein [Mycobacterium tuberculosis]
MTLHEVMGGDGFQDSVGSYELHATQPVTPEQVAALARESQRVAEMLAAGIQDIQFACETRIPARGGNAAFHHLFFVGPLLLNLNFFLWAQIAMGAWISFHVHASDLEIAENASLMPNRFGHNLQ